MQLSSQACGQKSHHTSSYPPHTSPWLDCLHTADGTAAQNMLLSLAEGALFKGLFRSCPAAGCSRRHLCKQEGNMAASQTA